MSKIVTLTFAPSIDKSATVSAVFSEKKIRCSALISEPGGGGINVARAIKKLGAEATAIYLAGGYSGITFTKLLAEESIETIVTEIKGNTRENFIVVETDTNKQYRFNMPGPKIFED